MIQMEFKVIQIQFKVIQMELNDVTNDMTAVERCNQFDSRTIKGVMLWMGVDHQTICYCFGFDVMVLIRLFLSKWKSFCMK